MISVQLVVTVAVQEGGPLQHFDASQAFVGETMKTKMYTMLPEGCGTLTEILENKNYSAFEVDFTEQEDRKLAVQCTVQTRQETKYVFSSDSSLVHL